MQKSASQRNDRPRVRARSREWFTRVYIAKIGFLLGQHHRENLSISITALITRARAREAWKSTLYTHTHTTLLFAFHHRIYTSEHQRLFANRLSREWTRGIMARWCLSSFGISHERRAMCIVIYTEREGKRASGKSSSYLVVGLSLSRRWRICTRCCI